MQQTWLNRRGVAWRGVGAASIVGYRYETNHRPRSAPLAGTRAQISTKLLRHWHAPPHLGRRSKAAVVVSASTSCPECYGEGACVLTMASWFGGFLRSEDLLPRHVGVLDFLNSVNYDVYPIQTRIGSKAAPRTRILWIAAADLVAPIVFALNLQGCTRPLPSADNVFGRGFRGTGQRAVFMHVLLCSQYVHAVQ